MVDMGCLNRNSCSLRGKQSITNSPDIYMDMSQATCMCVCVCVILGMNNSFALMMCTKHISKVHQLGVLHFCWNLQRRGGKATNGFSLREDNDIVQLFSSCFLVSTTDNVISDVQYALIILEFKVLNDILKLRICFYVYKHRQIRYFPVKEFCLIFIQKYIDGTVPFYRTSMAAITQWTVFLKGCWLTVFRNFAEESTSSKITSGFPLIKNSFSRLPLSFDSFLPDDTPKYSSRKTITMSTFLRNTSHRQRHSQRFD